MIIIRFVTKTSCFRGAALYHCFKKTKSMKKALILFLTGITLLIHLTTASAQAGNSKLLIGKWKFAGLSALYPPTMTGDELARRKIKVAAQATKLEGRSAEFLPNGELRWPGHKLGWKMDATGKQFKITKLLITLSVARILELSAHKLVFTRSSDGIPATYTFTR
jgi:hypothetical protein